MKTVSLKVMERAERYLDSAKTYLKDFQYMKVKKLAIALGVASPVAGCILTALCWIPINPNSRNNRTYERPS